MLLNIYIFILGTFFGSFLNVLIDRLPQEKSIGGRSHCDNCKKILGPLDLIPIISFLWLRGKCRYCGIKFSWFYPAFEALTGVVFLLTWNYFPSNNLISLKVINLGMVSTLLVIFFADLKYQIIPDSMQVTLFILTVTKYILLGTSVSVIIQYFLAGLAVMAPILAIFLITRGRGMGFGDVKFAFNIGLILGYLQGFLSLYIAFISGSIIGIILILFQKKKLKSAIAFGPFLVIGLVVMMLWGDFISQQVKYFYGF